jgi:peptide methionine sulfoxide reductase MsrA
MLYILITLTCAAALSDLLQHFFREEINHLSLNIQVTDLFKKYRIQLFRFYNWEKSLLKSSANILDDRGKKSTADQRKTEEHMRNLASLRETVM